MKLGQKAVDHGIGRKTVHINEVRGLITTDRGENIPRTHEEEIAAPVEIENTEAAIEVKSGRGVERNNGGTEGPTAETDRQITDEDAEIKADHNAADLVTGIHQRSTVLNGKSMERADLGIGATMNTNRARSCQEPTRPIQTQVTPTDAKRTSSRQGRHCRYEGHIYCKRKGWSRKERKESPTREQMYPSQHQQ